MIKDKNSKLLTFFTTLAQNIISLDVHKSIFQKFTQPTYEKIFHIFDHDKKGYLSLGNIYRFLRDYSITPTEDEMFFIFKEIDIKKKGSITLYDFIESLRPLKKDDKKMNTNNL